MTGSADGGINAIIMYQMYNISIFKTQLEPMVKAKNSGIACYITSLKCSETAFFNSAKIFPGQFRLLKAGLN